MKLKIIFFIGIFLAMNLTNISRSQVFISANDKHDVESIYQSYLSQELNLDQLKTKYPVHIINDDIYLSFIAKTDSEFNKQAITNLGCVVNETINQLATIKVPIEKIRLIEEFNGLTYLSLSKKMSNSLDKALKDTIDMASAAYKNDEGIVGVPTGLRDLDDRLGGLHKSDLIIIAGRPGMGKTALATNIAFNAAQKLQESGKKSSIAFFSLEMSSEQLSTRIISEQSRISSNDIRRGRISDDQFDKFLETSKNISELPLYIDETPAISIAALSNRARRIKRLFGLDMIVVDYIQLMKGTTFNKDGRVQEISQITQGLKAIAKELSVPVVALSQLSRQVEQRDDHKPQLADLRESGSIEQDADVVMFVYREGYYLQRKEPREATVEHAEWQAKMNEVAHLAQIIIGKQRHGPIGNVTLEFEERFTKFKDTQTN